MRDMINRFPSRGSSLVVEGQNGIAFKLYDTAKEYKMTGNDKLTVIDLGDCEKKLKDHYYINEPLLNMKFIIQLLMLILNYLFVKIHRFLCIFL